MKAESSRVFTVATRTLRRSFSTGRRRFQRTHVRCTKSTNLLARLECSMVLLRLSNISSCFTATLCLDRFHQRQCSEQVQPGRGAGWWGWPMWHSYVASCHHSRVEGLLWPLVLDGGYEVWQTGDVLGDQFSLVGSTLGEVISRDRFTQINKFLHFSDDSGLRNADKPHKVKYVLDECRQSFQAEYAPNREVAIDEAMVPFKGRLGMKQYMRDQPVSVSAYCHNFDVDVGKSNTCCDCHVWLSIKGGYRPLLKKGHLIYTDNFYTSPQLADYLYTQDTYLCGTIRTNRNGYPKQLVPSSAVARRMPRGSSDCSRLVHYSNWHPTGRTMESCSICRHSILRKVTSWLRQGAVRMVRCCSLTRHPRSKPMPSTWQV